MRHLETRKGEDVLLSFAYEYDGNVNRTSNGWEISAIRLRLLTSTVCVGSYWKSSGRGNRRK